MSSVSPNSGKMFTVSEIRKLMESVILLHVRYIIRNMGKYIRCLGDFNGRSFWRLSVLGICISLFSPLFQGSSSDHDEGISYTHIDMIIQYIFFILDHKTL